MIKDSVDWIYDEGCHITPNPQNFKKIKTLLDSTGNGFCLAKFKQATLHLGTGMVHSCHHPTPHRIPLDELKNNPSALFNTDHLKNVRKEMLCGERPKECDYCWRIENNNEYSDRQYKSLEHWALSDHDNITKLLGNENIYPSYLEVSFSNICNLNCIYCGPEFSSKWVDLLKNNGPIKLLEKTEHEDWVQGWQENLDSLQYKNREFNPYIDAFWKWFPEAYNKLKVFRITGGEPLLSKETFRVIDWFIENPNLELELGINSNLSVPDSVWETFIDKLTILKNKKVKKITMFISVDCWGKNAEFIRTNLNFNLLKERAIQLLELNNIRCVFMVTYNLLSITSFNQLLEWILKLKIKYNPNNNLLGFEKTGYKLTEYNSYHERNKINPDHNTIVGIDIPYLRHPVCLDAVLADKSIVEDYMIPSLNFMSKNMCNTLWSNHQGFEEYEVEKLKRIVINKIYHKNEDQLNINRAKFYEYILKINKMHNTNFLNIFPEMSNFFFNCKKENKKYLNLHET